MATSPLWRVERTDPARRFSLLNPVDVMNDRAGNRFDIPGAGVLYGATTPEGGFAETLAGLRPRSSMVAVFSALTPEPGQLCYRPNEPTISRNLLIIQEIHRHHSTVLTRSYCLAPTTVPILIRAHLYHGREWEARGRVCRGTSRPRRRRRRP